MKRLIASKGLEKLVPIKNPLDINPGADDEVHAYMAELLLNDENIDAVVIGLDPLSPVTHSLAETDIDAFRMDAPDGILTLLSDVRSRTSKPMVAVMDGGEKFEPLRKALRERGIPVFPVCDRASRRTLPLSGVPFGRRRPQARFVLFVKVDKRIGGGGGGTF